MDRDARIDYQSAGVMRFPTGAVAGFACGNRCGRVHTEARIHGSKGSVLVTDPWGPVEDGAPIIVNQGEEVLTLEVKLGADLYANEALAVAEHLEGRQAPQMSCADSAGQVRTMDALRAQIGLRFDCE
jgi:predicted dehydrogenase